MSTPAPPPSPRQDGPDGRGAFAIGLLVAGTATVSAGAVSLWGPGAGLIAFGLVCLLLGLAIGWQ